MEKRLDKRVAVVTGASSGIGSGIAKAFAAEGALVAVTSRSKDALQAVVDEIEKSGGEALAVAMDVRRREEVLRMVDTVLERFGRIDILVNNAAIARHKPIAEVTQEDWDDVVDTDLAGPFWCIQAASKSMVENGYGKIISIASTAGVAPVFPEEANYSAAKAGLVQMSRVVMKELGPSGINVNVIAPGVVDTPVHHAGKSEQETQKFYDWYAKDIASVNRVGTVEDVANLAVFLASEESSYISGEAIVIDGGRVDRF